MNPPPSHSGAMTGFEADVSARLAAIEVQIGHLREEFPRVLAACDSVIRHEGRITAIEENARTLSNRVWAIVGVCLAALLATLRDWWHFLKG